MGIHTPNFVTMTTEIRSLVNAAIFEHFDGDEDSDDALDSSELFDYDADSAAAVAGDARTGRSCDAAQREHWSGVGTTTESVSVSSARDGARGAHAASATDAANAVADADEETDDDIFALAREVSADESCSSEASGRSTSVRSGSASTNSAGAGASAPPVDTAVPGTTAVASKKPKKRFSKPTIDRGEYYLL